MSDSFFFFNLVTEHFSCPLKRTHASLFFFLSLWHECIGSHITGSFWYSSKNFNVNSFDQSHMTENITYARTNRVELVRTHERAPITPIVLASRLFSCSLTPTRKNRHPTERRRSETRRDENSRPRFVHSRDVSTRMHCRHISNFLGTVNCYYFTMSSLTSNRQTFKSVQIKSGRISNSRSSNGRSSVTAQSLPSFTSTFRISELEFSKMILVCSRMKKKTDGYTVKCCWIYWI